MNPITKASLEKIIKNLDEGKLGAKDDIGCVYVGEQDTFCAIGCLLSDDQKQFVIDNKLNTETGAWKLYKEVPSLSKDTGIAPNAADTIQGWHDAWADGTKTYEEFREAIQSAIETGMIRSPYDGIGSSVLVEYVA